LDVLNNVQALSLSLDLALSGRSIQPLPKQEHAQEISVELRRSAHPTVMLMKHEYRQSKRTSRQQQVDNRIHFVRKYGGVVVVSSH
jgi:hypothetical protein